MLENIDNKVANIHVSVLDLLNFFYDHQVLADVSLNLIRAAIGFAFVFLAVLVVNSVFNKLIIINLEIKLN